MLILHVHNPQLPTHTHHKPHIYTPRPHTPTHQHISHPPTHTPSLDIVPTHTCMHIHPTPTHHTHNHPNNPPTHTPSLEIVPTHSIVNHFVVDQDNIISSPLEGSVHKFILLVFHLDQLLFILPVSTTTTKVPSSWVHDQTTIAIGFLLSSLNAAQQTEYHWTQD